MKQKQKKEKGRRKPSLKITLTAAFLLFSAVLIVTLWIIQTIFLDSFYKSIKTSQVRSCARSVSENIDDDEIYDLITDIEEQNAMFVSVYRVEDGNLSSVYRSDKIGMMNSTVTNELARELYQKTVSAGGEYSEITDTGVERHFAPQNMMTFEGEQSTSPTPAQASVPKANAAMGEGDNTPPQENNELPSVSEEREQPEQSTIEPQPFEGGFGDPGAVGEGYIAPDGQNETANPGETVFDYRNKNSKENYRRHEASLEREFVSRLAYAIIHTTEDGERLIIVESEITPVTSVVETLRFQLIIMTAVLVVISVVIAFFTARSIAKPIADTNEKAKSFAKQDYDVEFKGGPYKEIKELNDTLAYSASELKKVDSLRKELISNISHDLRTPLTMITGYSEVMRDLPGEMTPENIQIIIDEASRLNSLVTDLLDISRLESGTADVKKTPFSLTRCIESIFSRYTKLIENEGFNITFRYEEEVFVEGDELRMTQVLYNLINNAINYVGDDKTVEVVQTVLEDKVRVDVIDHGEGIPAEQIPYIWDRYYRVDKEHKTAKIGTGLGLSIVKNILKAHDAQFGVESEPKKGSDFYFMMKRIQ